MIIPGVTFPRLVLSKMAGAHPTWLFVFNLNERELKMRFLICTSNISSMQQPRVAGGYGTAWHKSRMFPSFIPEVPLFNSIGLNIHC